MLLAGIALNCAACGVLIYTSRDFFHKGDNKDMESTFCDRVCDRALLTDPILLMTLLNVLLLATTGMLQNLAERTFKTHGFYIDSSYKNNTVNLGYLPVIVTLRRNVNTLTSCPLKCQNIQPLVPKFLTIQYSYRSSVSQIVNHLFYSQVTPGIITGLFYI